MYPMKFYRQFLITTLVSIVLAGCMVGPDFHSPASPKTNTYTGSPLPAKTVGTKTASDGEKSQHFYLVSGQEIPAAWWSLYHSDALNALICIGLANSPNLAAAQASLRQAEETFNAQIGTSLYPSVGVQLTGERQRLSSAGFGGDFASTTFNTYNASVNVSYTLDFFGAARRQIESLGAQIDYQNFLLEASYLTLTSNIVTTAVTIASLKAQIQATQQIIQSETDQLAIVKKQFNLGGASGSDVYSQETQLGQTRASLPPLEQSLAQNLHALSVLVGALPNENKYPELTLSQLHLPKNLPVSLPSSLVRQRPDIRASEALLHAASAQVGVATANLYPQITLTGAYGYENQTIANIFTAHNIAWNYGASLLQPIFNGGALRAKKRAAVAGLEQAAAQYRQTVLQAFQNVADTLRALQNDAKALKAEKEAEIAAKKTLTMTQEQFKLGGVSFLSLLIAQRQYQQTRIDLIKAQAARYADTAALFQALGGGWWNRKCCITS